MSNVSRWMLYNRLSLHLGKTEAILFGSKIRLKRFPGFKVLVGDNEINVKESVSYLGCLLDCHLSGVGHAQKVITKVNQRVRFLARILRFLDKKAMLTLANALIQPYFDYACCSWYNGVLKHLKHRLQTAQNGAIRLILNLPMRSHLDTSHFEAIGWLKVEDRVSQIHLCMVHRTVYGVVPKYLINYFNRVRDVHSYSTRGSLADFVLPRVKSNLGKESFMYVATSLWNRLPVNLKKIRSLRGFKALKKWLRWQF